MDKIITGFNELAEEAGFSVSVCDGPDGLLLNFLVYSEHEDFGNTIIGAIAEMVSSHWQVVCTAYVFSTIYKEGEAMKWLTLAASQGMEKAQRLVFDA